MEKHLEDGALNDGPIRDMKTWIPLSIVIAFYQAVDR